MISSGKKIQSILIATIICFPFLGQARVHNEAYYQGKWAALNGGKCEVILNNGLRCDIVTETHAIEVDFAKKWAEAVGQSLMYAAQTKKRAGIILILEHPRDIRYYNHVQLLINEYALPIDLWTIEM